MVSHESRSLRTDTTLVEFLKRLSDAATPGTWRAAPKRLKINGVEGPIMSYLAGDANSGEGNTVSLGSERLADHQFVAALVNAFRDGKLVESETVTLKYDPPAELVAALHANKELQRQLDYANNRIKCLEGEYGH